MKIGAYTLRCRPDTGSASKPRKPKSGWHSVPGSPSATRTVVAAERPYPQGSAQNRCVQYGTATPCHSSSTPIFTTVSSCRTPRPDLGPACLQPIPRLYVPDMAPDPTKLRLRLDQMCWLVGPVGRPSAVGVPPYGTTGIPLIRSRRLRCLLRE